MTKVIRSFICKWCSKKVVVTDPSDKRTVFCCDYCQRKYWKHPSEYRKNPSFDPDPIHVQKSRRKNGTVRFPVYLNHEDHELLRRKSNETGKTISALIREAIRSYKDESEEDHEL